MIGAGPERARRGDPAGRGRTAGDRARGRRSSRRRRAHRGADAAGFRHDTFSAVYPAGAASPVFARMPLERHGLRWMHPEACYAHPLPGGRAVALYRDLDRTEASLDAVHAGRRRAVARVRRADARRVRGDPGDDARRLPTGRGRARGCSAASGRSARRGSPRSCPARPQGSGARCSAAPARARGCTARPVTATSRRPAPEARSRRLPEPAGSCRRLAEPRRRRRAADRRARRLPARARWRGPHRRAVESIEAGARPGRRRAARRRRADRGRAGHRRRDAARARAPRRRGAAARLPRAPAPLSLRAGDGQGRLGARRADPVGGPRAARRRHRARRWRRGGARRRRSPTSQIRLPAAPFLLLGQQSLADPSRAPAGKHTAWAYTHGPRTGIDWSAELAPHVERIEAQVERFAPGFRERILARHVLSPGELERRDRNLVGGDVGGGSYRLRQVVFRPVPAPLPLPHAAARSLPRQRRGVPRWRRPRGARRRRRAGGARRRAVRPGWRQHRARSDASSPGTSTASQLTQPPTCRRTRDRKTPPGRGLSVGGL